MFLDHARASRSRPRLVVAGYRPTGRIYLLQILPPAALQAVLEGDNTLQREAERVTLQIGVVALSGWIVLHIRWMLISRISATWNCCSASNL